MKSRYLLGVVTLLAITWTATTHAQSSDSDCCDSDCCDCKSSGIVGGVDLMFLRLYARQGAGGNSAAGNIDDYFPDYGFNVTGRYWLGYEMSDGLGIRARFFEWQHSRAYLGRNREQAFKIVDVEATLDSTFYNWELTGIGGIRWGSIQLDGSDFGEPNPMNFEGTGLTLGVELRRPFWRNLSLIGGARYSVLCGQTDFEPVSTAVLGDTFIDITEVRLGVEWEMQMGSGGRLFANGVWEHQIYTTDTYMPFAIDPETVGDVSLAGPAFSIGINR